MKAKETIRYSEAFKRQVISELDAGKFGSAFSAERAYGIRGSGTVKSWLRKYGRGDLAGRVVTISTMSEQNEAKALKKRVRELEQALADTHMKGLLGEAYLEIACQRLGLEVADFKKKAATTPSGQPKEPLK